MAKGHITRLMRFCGLSAFLGAVALAAYLIWIGVTGQAIPTWFLAITTIL